MARRLNFQNGRWCVLAVTCGLIFGAGRGWAQDQEAAQGGDQQKKTEAEKNPAQLPDSPGESKKEDSANPVQAVGTQTKHAAKYTEHLAEEQLMKMRNWEATWISGVYIGKDQPLVTPTTKQREEIYLRQTLATPGAYMKRMFAAGIDQARGVPGQWDDGWGGYVERFASREGQFITANTLAALGNAKLGYEVRYDQCKCEGVWPRTKHAILRNFLTYDQSEENWRPQLALYGGAFGGGMVATAWKPSPKNVWSNGAYAMLGQAGYGTLLNFVIEFSREINKKQGVGR